MEKALRKTLESEGLQAGYKQFKEMVESISETSSCWVPDHEKVYKIRRLIEIINEFE